MVAYLHVSFFLNSLFSTLTYPNGHCTGSISALIYCVFSARGANGADSSTGGPNAANGTMVVHNGNTNTNQGKLIPMCYFDINIWHDVKTEGFLSMLTLPSRTFYIAYVSAICSISPFNTAPAKVAVKEKPLSNQTPSFFFGTDSGDLIYAYDLVEC